MKDQRRNGLGDRGVALAQTGIVLIALVSLTAVGVDVGRIAFTATEVQTLADLSATGGAKEIVDPLVGGTAQAGADVVIPLNWVDGGAGESSMVNVQTGNYDFTNGTFSDGGTPNNAVRATATVNVTTLLAGMFGSSNETVTKIATAAYGSLSGGQANLPITLCDTNFPDPDCMDDSCLPDLVQVPNGEDTSGWTGFFSTASEANVEAFFPSECESNQCNTAGDSTIPFLNVGDSINVNNGQSTPLLRCVQSCLDNGINEFLIPIINCPSSINQAVPILGFATIRVTNIVNERGDKHIEVDAMFNASAPGPVGGGGNFGTGSVALVS